MVIPRRAGIVEMFLARGPVPHYREIVNISGPIMSALVNEFGTKEVIRRFSNPLWFNCYACAVGFEWQYSGMGTVPLMAAKEALEKENIGIKIVGGKGRESKVIEKIPNVGDELGLSTKKIDFLSYASRLTCKADSVEIQDAHQLYFHCMIIDEKGNFTTINQKMSISQGTARRFHWELNPRQFVEEPHSGSFGHAQDVVLDLSSRKSRECRKTISDIVVEERPEKVHQMLLTLDRKEGQTKIIDWMAEEGIKIVKIPAHLQIPRKINIEALRIAHELNERDFEKILSIKGIGPATVRGLVYLSDLIYGTESSWKDPIRYTYAYGTKAGIPYFVEKTAMRESAAVLRTAIEEAKLGRDEKLNAIKRLRNFLATSLK